MGNYVMVDVSGEEDGDSCRGKLLAILEALPEFALKRTKIVMNKYDKGSPEAARAVLTLRNLSFPEMEIFLLPYDLEKIEKDVEETFLRRMRAAQSKRGKKIDRHRFSLKN